MPASPGRVAFEAFLAGLATGPFVEILLAFGVPGLWFAIASVAAFILVVLARFVPFLLWLTLYVLGLLLAATAAAFLYLGHF